MRRGLLSLVLAFVACWYLVSPASSATARGWTIMRSPHLAAPLSQLYDVSCTDPDWCMAVGYSGGAQAGQVEIRHPYRDLGWHGLVRGAQPRVERHRVQVPPRRFVPVPHLVHGGRPDQHANSNLAELWNGSSWSQVRTPNVSYGNQLNSVSWSPPASAWQPGTATARWWRPGTGRRGRCSRALTRGNSQRTTRRSGCPARRSDSACCSICSTTRRSRTWPRSPGTAPPGRRCPRRTRAREPMPCTELTAPPPSPVLPWDPRCWARRP